MSSYHLSVFDPSTPSSRRDFDVDVGSLMHVLDHLEDEIEEAPDLASLEDLASFDVESWLYLSHPDWKASGEQAVCSTGAVAGYANALVALSRFVDGMLHARSGRRSRDLATVSQHRRVSDV